MLPYEIYKNTNKYDFTIEFNFATEKAWHSVPPLIMLKINDSAERDF